MNNLNKIPKLRFAEFNDKWKEKKLGDLLNYEQPTDYLVKSTDYNNNNKTPVLTAGKSFILGYTNENFGIFNKNKLPVIIFDDFTTAIKYVDFPFKIKSSAIKILKVNKDNKIKFIFEAIGLIKYRVGGHERHWISKFRDITIQVPSIAEQERIANFLTQVDNHIDLQQKQLDLLKKYKQGLMQQIFSQKLRFKDDNRNEYPEWQNKTLGECVLSIKNGLSVDQNTKKNGFKVTRIETISNNVIDIEKVGYVSSDADISSYKLKTGDLLFSNINSPSMIGRTVFVDKEYELYHGINLLRIVINKSNNPKYVFYVLSSYKYKKYFEIICNKAVNQASINQTDLKKTKLKMPIISEQKKIANFLTILDDKIKIEESKLEQAKNFKKALLQQMFV